MTATQLWFGTDARPLAGRYHVPANELARGAVVLCQAFGVEAAASAPAMRELAERLVDEGLAVLRFDYDGTGDSAGDDLDDSRVEAWRASIVAAVEFLRSRGHRWIGAVGLRLGATLLAETLRKDVSASAAVLWDPCLSGRTFLREQQLLLRVLSGEGELPDNGCRFGPGVTYTESTTAALSKISLQDALPGLVEPTLLITREAQREAAALAESAARPGLTTCEVVGQIELVGVEPAVAQIPVDTLELIVKWLSQLAPTDFYEAKLPVTGPAIVGHTGSGDPIVEYAISIGTDGLFAICTEPTFVRSTTIIFLNAGLLDHVGPSRLWVELSRRWAALGFRSLRFDLSGIGESPALVGLTEPITRSVHSLRQVAEVVGFVAPDETNPDVLLVGLCSGAYQAMEAAIAGHARAVFLVNPDFRANPLQSAQVGESALKREVAESPAKWYSKLEQVRFLWPVARHFPDIIWRGIHSLGLATSRADTLVRLGDLNVETLVVSDPYQAESYARGRKSRLRRLAQQGVVTFARLDPLDHTVFGPFARESVSNVLTSWLEERRGTRQVVARPLIGNDGRADVS